MALGIPPATGQAGLLLMAERRWSSGLTWVDSNNQKVYFFRQEIVHAVLNQLTAEEKVMSRSEKCLMSRNLQAYAREGERVLLDLTSEQMTKNLVADEYGLPFNLESHPFSLSCMEGVGTARYWFIGKPGDCVVCSQRMLSKVAFYLQRGHRISALRFIMMPKAVRDLGHLCFEIAFRRSDYPHIGDIFLTGGRDLRSPDSYSLYQVFAFLATKKRIPIKVTKVGAAKARIGQGAILAAVFGQICSRVSLLKTFGG